MSTQRWRVEIVHSVDRKAKLWDHYATHERAQEIAVMLRRHGLFAQVRVADDPNEPPEHRGQRRAFLIWALMIDAIPPERLTARVLAEIESETAAS